MLRPEKEEDVFELREHVAIGSSEIVQTTKGFDVSFPFCAKDMIN
jgi:hypothetical protein